SRPPSETETPGEDLVLPESNRPVPALAMPTQLAHTAARLVTADSPSVSNERKNAIAESSDRPQRQSANTRVHNPPILPQVQPVSAPMEESRALRDRNELQRGSFIPQDAENPSIQTDSATLAGERDRDDSWPTLEPKVLRLVDDQLAHIQPSQSTEREPVEFAPAQAKQLPAPANVATQQNTPSILPARIVVARPAASLEQPQTISVT